MLSCRGITKRFGGLTAVDGVDLDVDIGSVVGLIGPNGAGKTTVISLISGFLRPDSGRIWLRGNRIDELAPHSIANSGLRRTFQLESMFPELTVEENVSMGGMYAKKIPTIQDLIALVGLEERGRELAKLLPYGLRRRLAVAIALAGDPSILLLDEPAAGMNFEESVELADLIHAVRDRGVAVLVVEHDMDVISRVADAIVVMDHGRVIASGPPAEVLSDRSVIEVYLGRWFRESS